MSGTIARWGVRQESTARDIRFARWPETTRKVGEPLAPEAELWTRRTRSGDSHPRSPLNGDPFLALGLSHDARPDDVRRAFRRLARETHPDRGGSAGAFHEVRVAYSALTANLERERSLWRPPPPEASRYAAGLDPAVYPTCPVTITSARDGRQQMVYDTNARPRGWTPGEVPPPGGECKAHVAATETAPAFGVWVVRVDAHRYRCVFGPPPSA